MVPQHGLGQARFFGHRCPRPVRRVPRSALQRRHQHHIDLLIGDGAGTTRTGLIVQPVAASLKNRRRHLPTVCGHTPTSGRHRCRIYLPRNPIRSATAAPAMTWPCAPIVATFTFVVVQYQRNYRSTPSRYGPILVLINEFQSRDTSNGVRIRVFCMNR